GDKSDRVDDSRGGIDHRCAGDAYRVDVAAAHGGRGVGPRRVLMPAPDLNAGDLVEGVDAVVLGRLIDDTAVDERGRVQGAIEAGRPFRTRRAGGRKRGRCRVVSVARVVAVVRGPAGAGRRLDIDDPVIRSGSDEKS